MRLLGGTGSEPPTVAACGPTAPPWGPAAGLGRLSGCGVQPVAARPGRTFSGRASHPDTQHVPQFQGLWIGHLRCLAVPLTTCA